MNRLFLIISPLLFLCGCTQRQETTPTYFDDIDTEGLVTQDTVGTRERDEQIAKEGLQALANSGSVLASSATTCFQIFLVLNSALLHNLCLLILIIS